MKMHAFAAELDRPEEKTHSGRRSLYRPRAVGVRRLIRREHQPVRQGRAWELQDYKSGDIAVAIDTQVLDAHCTSTAPAGFTSQQVQQFESG